MWPSKQRQAGWKSKRLQLQSEDSRGTYAKAVDQVPDPPAPVLPKIEFRNRDYRQGAVTALTKDSITVQCPDWVGQKPVRGPDGIARWQTVTLPAEEPKRFALSEVLASGQMPDPPNDVQAMAYELYRYRLTDVKVGDWVCVKYSRVSGADICTYIQIVKRPGGRIPPLPKEVKEKSTILPYHERMQAYWDLEDKSIPYPEKFGFNRRWPVAPSPRVVETHP